MRAKKSLTVFQISTALQISEQKKLIIQKYQEKIFRFFIEIVKTWETSRILEEFKKTFIYPQNKTETETAIYEIIFANDEEEFINTIKRCCYIIINNWLAARKYSEIKELVELFNMPLIYEETSSMTINHLRKWLINFIKSKDFDELKLFAKRYEEKEEKHWSDRYTSYLLMHQYVNVKNPPEQREAARIQAQQLKEKFKFDLAMYTARSNIMINTYQKPKNPTILGDEVLQLIKTIITKRGQFSYVNIANIFLKQTEGIKYKNFKQSLQKYLIYSVERRECVLALNVKLSKKLQPLYKDQNEKTLTDALLLRTCKRVVEFLTTEDRQKPSSLFVLLLSQGHALTLVIILLKITLICKQVRPHLEACIAELIKYYLKYPEEECKWVVNFLEIFRITFVIYDENVQYNLLQMKKINSDKNAVEIQDYRIFSQIKFVEEDSEETQTDTSGGEESLSEEYTNPFTIEEDMSLIDADIIST
ncbi:MAG: hypothetical protein N3E45_03495 [Oscillatoriaceae bacterium SKW80]|nr:hypothetical protein [Oscillatoriaceae bacterium SKYG93]MCX8119885.1 hypothetical protein [Oscillatoriaceae bacterium SKW80]MDW8452008.1 hypothetical protein [Oscillatoriaceae cyanobacterium SKYGB_i_bin93]HIK27550.1 hypothetical protein [Oscillatoriaceae cyanobacterium M7585_C2015_266]